MIEELERRRTEMAKSLREWADNPAVNGMVPVSPQTLREVAELLEGQLPRRH